VKQLKSDTTRGLRLYFVITSDSSKEYGDDVLGVSNTRHACFNVG
jgi:hypothetical protein